MDGEWPARSRDRARSRHVQLQPLAGPGAVEAYSPLSVSLWRLNWDTSAGPIADMGPHYCQFAQWARGDELSGPVE